jgi:hypothetical protein
MPTLLGKQGVGRKCVVVALTIFRSMCSDTNAASLQKIKVEREKIIHAHSINRRGRKVILIRVTRQHSETLLQVKCLCHHPTHTPAHASLWVTFLGQQGSVRNAQPCDVIFAALQLCLEL